VHEAAEKAQSIRTSKRASTKALQLWLALIRREPALRRFTRCTLDSRQSWIGNPPNIPCHRMVQASSSSAALYATAFLHCQSRRTSLIALQRAIESTQGAKRGTGINTAKAVAISK